MIPKHLAEARYRQAKEYAPWEQLPLGDQARLMIQCERTGFIAGSDWLYTHLLSFNQNAFDEKPAREIAYKIREEILGEERGFVVGARWQAENDRAQIAALKAELTESRSQKIDMDKVNGAIWSVVMQGTIGWTDRARRSLVSCVQESVAWALGKEGSDIPEAIRSLDGVAAWNKDGI